MKEMRNAYRVLVGKPERKRNEWQFSLPLQLTLPPPVLMDLETHYIAMISGILNYLLCHSIRNCPVY
jgi:hypothetical protein